MKLQTWFKHRETFTYIGPYLLKAIFFVNAYYETCCAVEFLDWNLNAGKCCKHNRLETTNWTQLCLTQHLEFLLAETCRKEPEIIIQQIPSITAQLSVLVVNYSPQQWLSKRLKAGFWPPCCYWLTLWSILLNATKTLLEVVLYMKKGISICVHSHDTKNPWKLI